MSSSQYLSKDCFIIFLSWDDISWYWILAYAVKASPPLLSLFMSPTGFWTFEKSGAGNEMYGSEFPSLIQTWLPEKFSDVRLISLIGLEYFLFTNSQIFITAGRTTLI